MAECTGVGAVAVRVEKWAAGCILGVFGSESGDGGRRDVAKRENSAAR